VFGLTSMMHCGQKDFPKGSSFFRVSEMKTNRFPAIVIFDNFGATNFINSSLCFCSCKCFAFFYIALRGHIFSS